MEFQFGTNWARYVRFVGDIFGSPLAIEGIYAFLLESGFLALLLFGWHKIGPHMHFFSTCMVLDDLKLPYAEIAQKKLSRWAFRSPKIFSGSASSCCDRPRCPETWDSEGSRSGNRRAGRSEAAKPPRDQTLPGLARPTLIALPQFFYLCFSRPDDLPFTS